MYLSSSSFSHACPSSALLSTSSACFVQCVCVDGLTEWAHAATLNICKASLISQIAATRSGLRSLCVQDTGFPHVWGWRFIWAPYWRMKDVGVAADVEMKPTLDSGGLRSQPEASLQTETARSHRPQTSAVHPRLNSPPLFGEWVFPYGWGCFHVSDFPTDSRLLPWARRVLPHNGSTAEFHPFL